MVKLNCYNLGTIQAQSSGPQLSQTTSLTWEHGLAVKNGMSLSYTVVPVDCLEGQILFCVSLYNRIRIK